MKIGFVTCAAEKLPYYFPTLAEPLFVPVEPPFTPDDQIAVDALRERHHEVHAIVWGSAIQSLQSFDLIIVRSPWDYMDSDENKSQFLQWLNDLESAGLCVANPMQFMQWMLDKHYLQHLGDAGVSVIPTQYYEKKSTLNLLEHFAERGQFVLKPCISAAGIGLFHIKTKEEALTYQEEINQRLQTCSYMLQDFIEEITTEGEWSLIFLGGKYSHALHKKPGPASILVHAERGGSLSFERQPAQYIVDFANAVYEKIFPAFSKATRVVCDPQLVLYLRLDIIDTKKGPVLIECEGVEPELFFRAKSGAEMMFCDVVTSTSPRPKA